MTTKFCTVDQVKAQLQSGGFDYIADNSSITDHIQQATQLVRSYTRRNFEKKQRTQHFSTPDIRVLLGVGDAVARFTFNETPLVTVDQVQYAPDGDWQDADILSSILYEVDTDKNAMFIYPSRLFSRARSLRVMYTAGFEIDVTDTELLLVDAGLRQATAVQAAFTWRRMVNQTTGTKQKQDKLGLVNYSLTPSGLVSDALALCKHRTRLLVGGNG